MHEHERTSVGLQGSTREAQALQCSGELDRLRAGLKHSIRAAWAGEAVRQGVALAKRGEHERALADYARALDLDAGHADALVAQGAALANLSRFHDALASFRAALGACHWVWLGREPAPQLASKSA